MGPFIQRLIHQEGWKDRGKTWRALVVLGM